MHMGYEEKMVQILEWNGPRLSRLGAWQVMDGDCTGSQSRHSLTVLKVKPGQPFKILGDVYKGNCKTDKRVSSGKAVPPFELYSPEIFAAPINGN